ncbi:MAG: hypothetical protein AAFO94_13455, partial [Bacteroidota bacterium]
MLKKLKSLFIIEEEESAPKSSPKKETVAAEKTAPEAPVATPVTQAAGPGKVSNKFLQVLLSAMNKANLEGFDYLEYKQSLKSLEKMPMDEKTRYISAFAAAQTMGATPDKLVQAANHYLKVLAQEDKKFEQALINQRSKQVGDKQKQIKQSE